MLTKDQAEAAGAALAQQRPQSQPSAVRLPPRVRFWVVLGLAGGFGVGLALSAVLDNGLFMFVAAAVGAVLGRLFGAFMERQP